VWGKEKKGLMTHWEIEGALLESNFARREVGTRCLHTIRGDQSEKTSGMKTSLFT